MIFRKNKVFRGLTAAVSLFIATFAVLPPQGICLRELLSQSQCCLDGPEASRTQEPALPACCAAHAACSQPDRKSPAGIPSQDSGLCLVTSSDPYLAPASNPDGYTDELVAAEALPFFAVITDSFELSAAARLSAKSAASGAPPLFQALRRGTSVLRI